MIFVRFKAFAWNMFRGHSSLTFNINTNYLATIFVICSSPIECAHEAENESKHLDNTILIDSKSKSKLNR